jgi:diguanylate cyclase (GGDEF)-like protein
LAARFGGEEFVVVLPDASLEQTVHLSERLCRGIEALALPHLASTVSTHVTASIGAALTIPAQGGSPLQLVDLADRALYKAKAAGRNRAVAQDGLE